MADAIHGVTQFCKQLKVGDVFWHITSRYGEPYAVEGPCEIQDIFLERTMGRTVVMVQYVRPWVEISECIVEDAVSDLVNERHGVFLNHDDAIAELGLRRRKIVEGGGDFQDTQEAENLRREDEAMQRRDLLALKAQCARNI